MRLDQYLVEQGFAPSRARAQAMVRAGQVLVNGVAAAKPSQKATPADEVILTGDVHDYVSRGALKLLKGLELVPVSPAGKACLDLGASTGGFTQVLLRAGAARVFAVDVGHGQLHERIAGEARVINLERTHAKDLSPQMVPEEVQFLVCDVSFISLQKALPPAMALCGAGAACVALIKPQFEVGRAQIGKGGLVLDTEENTTGLVQRMADWFTGQGWQVTGTAESPIQGGDGNREFLIGAVKEG